jgi:hypothetical protein
MRVNKNLLDRLPPPNAFDYVVTFFCSLLVLFFSMLTVAGLPVPPAIFELLLVDYRVFFVSTKAERMANKVAFLESIQLEERYQKSENPNTYLKMMYRYYTSMKRYLEKHPVQAVAS